MCIIRLLLKRPGREGSGKPGTGERETGVRTGVTEGAGRTTDTDEIGVTGGTWRAEYEERG